MNRITINYYKLLLTEWLRYKILYFINILKKQMNKEPIEEKIPIVIY